jgi:hypothetical protein
MTMLATRPALRPVDVVDRWMADELDRLTSRQLGHPVQPLLELAFEGRLDHRSWGALMLVVAVLADRELSAAEV